MLKTKNLDAPKPAPRPEKQVRFAEDVEDPPPSPGMEVAEGLRRTRKRGRPAGSKDRAGAKRQRCPNGFRYDKTLQMCVPKGAAPRGRSATSEELRDARRRAIATAQRVQREAETREAALTRRFEGSALDEARKAEERKFRARLPSDEIRRTLTNDEKQLIRRRAEADIGGGKRTIEAAERSSKKADEKQHKELLEAHKTTSKKLEDLQNSLRLGTTTLTDFSGLDIPLPPSRTSSESTLGAFSDLPGSGPVSRSSSRGSAGGGTAVSRTSSVESIPAAAPGTALDERLKKQTELLNERTGQITDALSKLQREIREDESREQSGRQSGEFKREAFDANSARRKIREERDKVFKEGDYANPRTGVKYVNEAALITAATAGRATKQVKALRAAFKNALKKADLPQTIESVGKLSDKRAMEIAKRFPGAPPIFTPGGPETVKATGVSRSKLSDVMNKAEASGKRSVAADLRELKAIHKDIEKTIAYVKSL